MDMRDEVEQIILRTMVKEGMDAAPQDYEFLNTKKMEKRES